VRVLVEEVGCPGTIRQDGQHDAAAVVIGRPTHSSRIVHHQINRRIARTKADSVGQIPRRRGQWNRRCIPGLFTTALRTCDGGATPQKRDAVGSARLIGPSGPGAQIQARLVKCPCWRPRIMRQVKSFHPVRGTRPESRVPQRTARCHDALHQRNCHNIHVCRIALPLETHFPKFSRFPFLIVCPNNNFSPSLSS